MWIVFGWQKEEKPVAEVGSGYCYDCRRRTMWVVWNESEWVTFSDIRTLRFVNRNRLHCESCTFRSELTRAEFNDIKNHIRTNDSIDGTPLHAKLMKRIESEQLAGKTPLQLKFIRDSMAAESEYRQRLAENERRDA
jgi:hypothetical protein